MVGARPTHVGIGAPEELDVGGRVGGTAEQMRDLNVLICPEHFRHIRINRDFDRTVFVDDAETPLA